jgi:hypothetical protein
MRSRDAIRKQSRKLRKLIDSDSLSKESTIACYWAEHALRWVLAKRGYDRNYPPQRACLTERELEDIDA